MLALLLCLLSPVNSVVVPPADLAESQYHPWAHSHWVWLHHSESNQANISALIDDYLEHDIPVGGLNIDSEWATQFNNFEVDTAKFPDFNGLIQSMQDRDIHTIMWVTSMVNEENPDYEMCVENDYLVRNGYGLVRPIKWWHGSGGLLDYSNPDARAWWHSKMDKVLNAGIDGFKCDGTDPYILEYQLTTGALGYQNKSLTYKEYADYYYGDFFNYTREVRGDAGLIMSRPIDCADTQSLGCFQMSPPYVMFSGWVGDDDASFRGLRSCMRKVIFSAHNDNANFGCDIGGYRGTDDKLVLIRWVQLGAFLPLMENGGGGEHRPWMYDAQTTDIYRSYVFHHMSLSHYLLTAGNQAREQGASAITPLAPGDDENPLHNPDPIIFSYLLGADLLIHPIITNPEASGVNHVTMHFPTYDSSLPATEWLDWFHPSDANSIIQGDGSGEAFHKERIVLLHEFPVYVRRGALIPMEPLRTSARTAASDAVMFTWYAPTPSSSTRAECRELVSSGSGLVSTVNFSDMGVLSATLTAHPGRAGSGWSFVGVAPANEFVLTVEDGTSDHRNNCEMSYNAHSSVLDVTCLSVALGIEISIANVISTV